MKWRLVTDVVAMVSNNGKEVYLVAPEEESYINKLKKLVGPQVFYGLSKFFIEGNKFNVRIALNSDIYISNSLLFCGKELKLMNYYESDLIKFIIQSGLDSNGNVMVPVEVCFSVESEKVYLVTEKMDNYDKTQNETERILKCEICKKTTKWIPGHKYDIIDSSKIYLGSILTSCPVSQKELCQKTGSESITWNSDISTYKEVYLYIDELKDTDKTIEDILVSRPIGYSTGDIHILEKKHLAVDSGEVIDMKGKTLSDIINQDIYNTILKNTISQWTVRNNYLQQTYVLDPIKGLVWLNYIVQGIDLTKTKYIVIDFLKIVADNLLSKYWCNNSYRSDYNIKPENDSLVNFDILESLILKKFNRILYWKELFEKGIEINLQNDVAKYFSDWRNYDRLTGCFSDYLKHYLVRMNYMFKNSGDIKGNSYFYVQENGIKEVSIRTSKSCRYPGMMDTGKISDSLGSGDLKKLVIDLILKAESDFGYGISNFEILNSGSITRPMIFKRAFVTIEDIINYFSGIQSIPKNIQKEIIQNKFVGIVLEFDNSETFEKI